MSALDKNEREKGRNAMCVDCVKKGSSMPLLSASKHHHLHRHHCPQRRRRRFR